VPQPSSIAAGFLRWHQTFCWEGRCQPHFRHIPAGESVI
jgi:hypothetical protein